MIYNVLSLFDGISCGRVALERAGIKVGKYYASEIDKYAIKVAQKNYPDTIQLGDATKWMEWGIDWKNIGVVFGGFPCQSWSTSGKQLGDKDPRGKLLWTMLDILHHIQKVNPSVIFLLENVKMKKEFMDYVNKAIGVYPILIDSALVSAQMRKRNYWTNIKNIPQPEDKKIYLKDIVEHGLVDRDKSLCIDANYFKGGNLVQYFEKHRRQLVFDEPVQVAHIKNNSQGSRVYSTRGKNVCLKALGGGWGAKTGLIACVAERGRKLDESGTRDDETGKIVRGYEYRGFYKTGCLTTVQKDNYLVEDLVIRKLSPLECERLQTLPEKFTEGISNSQRYKVLGNGWTVDVISHILSFIPDKGV